MHALKRTLCWLSDDAKAVKFHNRWRYKGKPRISSIFVSVLIFILEIV